MRKGIVMEQFSGQEIPAGSRWFKTGRDLKPLENVEQHLRAQLEIERRVAARPAPAPANAVSLPGDGLPMRHHPVAHGEMVLAGRLCSMAPTMDRQIYRAYLKHMGVTSVLYINFELGTCLAMALMPSGIA